MSEILGKTKNSSSRKSIVLIQIGTKSPSYPATGIGTIGTNSATKTHFSATALFRFSATNSPPRDSPSTSRCIAASPSQIRFQPGATAHSTPLRNKLQSCLRYDDRNNSSHRNLHGTPRHCHPSYSHQPYGTPRTYSYRNTQPKLFQIRRSEHVYPRRYRLDPVPSPFQLRLPATRERPYLHLSEHAAKLLQIQPSEQGVEVISSPFWRR